MAKITHSEAIYSRRGARTLAAVTAIGAVLAAEILWMSTEAVKPSSTEDLCVKPLSEHACGWYCPTASSKSSRSGLTWSDIGRSGEGALGVRRARPLWIMDLVKRVSDQKVRARAAINLVVPVVDQSPTAVVSPDVTGWSRSGTGSGRRVR
jgi:hypothetical protein